MTYKCVVCLNLPKHFPYFPILLVRCRVQSSLLSTRDSKYRWVLSANTNKKAAVQEVGPESDWTQPDLV